MASEKAGIIDLLTVGQLEIIVEETPFPICNNEQCGEVFSSLKGLQVSVHLQQTR